MRPDYECKVSQGHGCHPRFYIPFKVMAATFSPTLRLMNETNPTTHVLLVEDDEIDVMNVQRAFKKQHIEHPIYVASNGLEALAILRGEQGVFPTSHDERRVILLDLNMPKMNGIEFLQELRADPDLQSLVVIVLTTSDQERDRVEAYKFNVAGYILKPVTFKKFLDVVAALNSYWSICEMP